MSVDGSMASAYAMGQGSVSSSGSGSSSGSSLTYRYQQPAVVVSIEPARYAQGPGLGQN